MESSALDFDAFSEGRLKKAFSAGVGNERAALLCAGVRGMADGLRGVSIVAELASIDPKSFVGGLKSALAENPKNLTAARALLWFYIRNSSFQEARTIYAEIEKHWSKYDEIFLEHMRTLIIDSSSQEAGAVYTKSQPFLRRVSSESYKLQISYLMEPETARKRQSDLLKLGELSMQNALALSDANRADLLSPSELSAVLQLTKMIAASDRVALVGNAPSLLRLGRGAEIDDFDLVIRCNFPDITGYEKDVGSRTDVVAFNETVRHKLKSARGRSTHFADTLSIGLHPESAFGLPTAGEYASYENVGTLPPSARRFLAEVCYARCTTGLMAINMMIFLLHKKVALFGFDFFSDTARPHYFGAQKGAYLGHELQYEQWFVTKFLADNYPELIQFET